MATQTKKITVDTAALVVGRVGGLLLGVVRLQYLAAYLEVANFGILNFAAFFTSLFQALFDFGIAQLLTREIARHLEASRDLLGRALGLKILVVCVAALAVGAAAMVSDFDEETNIAILLTTVVLAVTSMSTAFLSALQAHRRMTLVSGLTIANDVALSVGVIALIPLFPHVPAVLVIMLVMAMLHLGVLAVVYTRLVGAPVFRLDLPAWRVLLRDGFPLAVSALGISTYLFIGPIVLQYTRGKIEVGIYSAGYKLISILTLLPVAFTQVVYPVFSQFHEHTPEKLEKALRDALRVMMQLSVPLGVGAAIVSPYIIGFLYTPAYAGAEEVLRLIVIGNTVGFLGWIQYSFLIAIRRQTYCMWNSVLVGLAVLSVNLVFVPLEGYRAVAIIAMGTEFVLFVSFTTYIHRLGYRLFHTSVVAKVAGATALMGVIVWLVLPWHFVPAVAAGIIIYAVLLVSLGTFGDQEREMIRRLFNR